MLASKSKEQKDRLLPIDEQDILALEACIDDYENFLPAMTHFIPTWRFQGCGTDAYCPLCLS